MHGTASATSPAIVRSEEIDFSSIRLHLPVPLQGDEAECPPDLGLVHGMSCTCPCRPRRLFGREEWPDRGVGQEDPTKYNHKNELPAAVQEVHDVLIVCFVTVFLTIVSV